MARHYIPDERTRNGEKLFTNDRDGDSPNRQTVYKEHKGGGGNEEVKGVKYDPKERRFKK